jgi:hypothetical protein
MRFVLLVIWFVTACSTTTVVTKKPPTLVEYRISKDHTPLGTLTIAPGQVGTLVATPDGAELTALWKSVLDGKQGVVVDSHTNRKGSREYNSRLYSPGQDDYAEGVGRWLQYTKGYDVEKTERR